VEEAGKGDQKKIYISPSPPSHPRRPRGVEEEGQGMTTELIIRIIITISPPDPCKYYHLLHEKRMGLG
jgi:hypothetical protein